MPIKKSPLFLFPNDPILVKRAKKIDKDQIKSNKVRNIIEEMLRVGYGEQSDRKRPVLVGLAAPQIGISKRIIMVDVGADGKGNVSKLCVYINPKIIWRSKEKVEWYEGCFSTSQVAGIVKRPYKIKIEAISKTGKFLSEKHEGYVARIFQHEIDHLNGKEFVNYIKDSDKLHWVEDDEYPNYRDKEAWRNWPNKCSFAKWSKIKGT